jgi:D-arabinose 1-dehydrogenase-like Zn-dependent alcohol dehydrogenase
MPTDLQVVDGELPDPRLPIIPGHEIVGRVAACGEGVSGLAVGARVGLPWLGATCGVDRDKLSIKRHLRIRHHEIFCGCAKKPHLVD